ncbi:MAG: DUF883 C-terminal domain-containing protein [Legionella sp.]|nr:DUF883 C-terminal domain-containing protein [Legionella sp.]
MVVKKNQNESHVVEAANELLKESKKKANELYEEGKHTFDNVQKSIKTYSDDVVHKVHAKPLTSLLIAGGIGFILSSLLRR